jgi:hypothetical protein
VLRIRQEQIAALAEDRLRREVRGHLRRAHPEAVGHLAFDVLAHRVAHGVTRARAAGLTWVSSVTGFVALMFTIGPDFHHHGLVGPVLKGDHPDTAGLGPDERLFALGHVLRPEHWEQIRQHGGHWPEILK